MASGLIFQELFSEKEIKKHINPSFADEVRDYFLYFLKVFLIVTFVYMFIRIHVFDVIGISGHSMYPAYNDRDAIYIDEWTPKFGDYRRGDVVVLVSPPDLDGKRELYIKRIIGVPGEKVVLEDGKVYIYNKAYPKGVQLDERAYLKPNVKTYKRVISGGERYEEETLGPDEYYVLGDNRTGSMDSRFFGKIKKKDILGREFYRILPTDKSGFFTHPKYNITD
jgi:signal peptidase I